MDFSRAHVLVEQIALLSSKSCSTTTDFNGFSFCIFEVLKVVRKKSWNANSNLITSTLIWKLLFERKIGAIIRGAIGTKIYRFIGIIAFSTGNSTSHLGIRKICNKGLYNGRNPNINFLHFTQAFIFQVPLTSQYNLIEFHSILGYYANNSTPQPYRNTK